MNEDNRVEITLSPYVPADLTSTVVYVAPEGGHRPIDGKFPLFPFIYSDWEKEELSWYDNCYIHAGLNPFLFEYFKGTDLLKLATDYTVNSFTSFPVGKARHIIRCDDNGKILSDGILWRLSEDEFLGMCSGLIEIAAQNTSKYDLQFEDQSNVRFFYQLCGPRSLEVVEAAAEEDLHDIKFMFGRAAKIGGKDVMVLRTSMAGTLGYEVHGMKEDALAVYSKLLEVGEEFGITEIGRHAYRNTHTEGSIPQATIHFTSPNFMKADICGSIDPDSELVYRSPYDVGWGNLVKFDHEFPGKEALLAEMNRPHNTCVHLIWNPDDIIKVIRTYFEPGNSCSNMDMVEDYDYIISKHNMRIDEVYDGEKLIGAVSGRMLSPKTGEMISLCTIAEEYAVEGKEVEVLWGNRGSRQMRIRATVVLFPYIKEGRNADFDIEKIPHRFPKKA